MQGAKPLMLMLLFGFSVQSWLGCLGCSRQQNCHMNEFDPGWAEEAGRRAIQEYDTDGNGKIDGAELDKCPGLKALLRRTDPSGQGGLTADMIAARIKAWHESRLGRMIVPFRVTHNGKPLEGAEVKFVPEKFLGEYMITATGTTDSQGFVAMSVPLTRKTDPSGVPPGFYRIEITKPGIKIPEKYNVKTELGIEVSINAEWADHGLEFDLDY
jgi:hypothetical protein